MMLAGLVSVSYAGELDMLSRAQLRQFKLEQKQMQTEDAGVRRLRQVKSQLGVGGSESIGMIKLSAGRSTSDLEAEGVTVLRQRGDIVLVSVPTEEVERIAGLSSVSRMQLARTMRPMLDKAREASGVEAVSLGTDLPHAYTGKGVLTGIVDGGVDPNHINFRDGDGNTRVGYLGHIRLNSAGSQILETRYGKMNDLPVSSFTTDDPAQFHGTHTTGIMAGSYKGLAKVAEYNPTTQLADITEKANPYYGVATESEIAISCGDLMDMLIAMGIDDICQYATLESMSTGEARKPIVINLSLGSNVGPHDGSDVMHQFIDQIVAQDNAIICVSAGNEGDLPIALHGTFDENRRELKTFIRPFVYTDLRYGNLAIYSEDSSEFTVQAVVYNKSRGKVAFSAVCGEYTGGEATYYVSGDDYKTGSNDVVSPTFAKAFDGYVGIGSMKDENTGRYYAMIDYYCVDAETNVDGNYIFGFIVTPKDGCEGKRIDVYADGQFCAFDNYGQSGWDEGMYDGTVSDMACGDNILVVGSYNTRDNWGSLDGYGYSYNGSFPAGEITMFSSYGRLLDGRELPHVCAPGAAIISSTNSYYVADSQNGITPSYLHAEATDGNRTYHWQQTTGTSMSTPYVAGAIATWLEADPNLTIADVKDIVAKTSKVDSQVESTGNSLQWGAGKFDAHAGLKEVIRRVSGIQETGAADSRLIVSRTGRELSFFLGGASRMDVSLYDLSGKEVSRHTSTGDEARIDTRGLQSGIYVARVNGGHTTKVMVK